MSENNLYRKTPLMIGCDLTKISYETLEILKNKELITINQDSACLQAFVVKEIRDNEDNMLGEVWIKDLGKKNSNEKAIAFLNRSDSWIEIDFNFEDAGLTGNIESIRNLCYHKNEECTNTVTMSLKPHETVVYRVVSETSKEVINPADSGELLEKPLNKISIEEAMKLVEDGANLVDVRTKAEYEQGYLDGAINVPYTEIHASATGILEDKSKPVIVYCTTGKRSYQAKTSLECLGYENVYYLGGVEF